MTHTFRVFKNSRTVRVAHGGRASYALAHETGSLTTIRGYRTELVARGTGTVMYTSKVCETREQADALCDKWLSRNPHILDTSGAA